jgi:hypothetical protein
VADHAAKQPAVSAATNPTPKQYRSVKVEMTIEGKNFRLEFQPDLTPTKDVATRLCTERGASFGVTQASLPYCIQTITNYLDVEVKK